jgi:ParB family chromosome partitioning protein
VTRVAIDWIRVDGRCRKDPGSLESLAASIKKHGLIYPVVITPDGQLISGSRRIAAVRMLGWTHVDTYEVTTLDDASRFLVMERGEGAEHLPMTPGELMKVSRILDVLDQPEMRARRSQAGRVAAAKRLGRPIPDAAPVVDRKERRHKDALISQALGLSETNYYYIRAVVGAASDPHRTPKEREIAATAMADMDNGLTTVTAAYDRVRNSKPVRTGREPAPTIDKPGPQRRAITTAETTLAGIAHALRQIEELHSDIKGAEITQWISSLTDSRRAITVLINRLKERSSGVS